MPSRQDEQNANIALGALLEGMMPTCAVRAENTRVIVGQPGLKPDILITAPDRAPVVIEAEFMPAADVERDATDRLGLVVEDGRRPIEAAIALRYPERLEFSGDMNAAMRDAVLEYAVFHPDGTRFPESGWLSGSPSDLAELARLVSVPREAVERATDALQEGIENAVAVMDDMRALKPFITPRIADLLGMSDVPQTRRMACAIMANATVFHDRVAGIHQEVMPLDAVAGPDALNPKSATIAAWNHILTINYWPIFAIARDILRQIPGYESARILRRLHETAGNVAASGASVAHDLTGRVFQKLIADRKYLATFYTLPSSAALLARLAVARMDGIDWSDAEAIGKLKVGDFACGTGALLSAVYEQIAVRHENAGGDLQALHSVMMEEVLYGCDVMPSAIHITGSTLSGARPGVKFGKTRLYPMTYGRQSDGSVRIGSLEALQDMQLEATFDTSATDRRLTGTGEDSIEHHAIEIPHGSFDLVIMNPPFTRATNHEGARADITNPAFAAFNATSADQTEMGKRINRMGRDTCYHGNAGIASAFAALGHRKLKPGGVLAMVLPLSAAAGLSWQKFRRMLAKEYTDLTVCSIVDNRDELAFSSDTGMAECLVIARKAKKSDKTTRRANFVSLTERPSGFADARETAQSVISANQVRQLEGGPYGGRLLTIGDEQRGEMIDAPCPFDGSVWGAVRQLDYSVSQTAYALANSDLWLPGERTPIEVLTAPLSEVGRLGLVSRDINGPAPRGPFDLHRGYSPTATYPALWNHDASKETHLVCLPDSQLRARLNMEDKASTVWATRSRAHHNVDFRYNSQPLGVAITEASTIGGRAWPNVRFDDERFDYAFAVWGNSTLGLICHWWHANRQVAGRGTTSIRSAESLPILDLRALSDAQLATAQDIFDEFRHKELKPAYIADADPNRALLDKRVVCDLLGLNQDTYEAVRRLSAKWCAEPSVHGGKRRPNNANLVM